MAENPFCGPRLKVERAKAHIADLEKLLNDYSNRVKYGFVEVKDDYNDQFICLQLRFSERPPAEIPLLIGHAIHNLRGALDLLVCDVARLRGKSTNKIMFPFTESAEKLDEKLKGGA